MFLVFVKKKTKQNNLYRWVCVRYCAVYQPRSTLLCMINSFTQSDMLHSYEYFDSTILWSYNTASILASFVTFWYRMRCTASNLNKIYILQIRTCNEILAQNGFYKMGA